MSLPRVLAALVLASALTACDSGGDAPGASAPPEVPRLEPAWTSSAPGADRAWLVDGLLATAGDDRLAGIDTATGETRWTRRVPAGICALPTTPDDDGVLAVLLRQREKPRACTVAAAIDLRDGTVRWRRDLSPDHPADWKRADFDGVGAARRVVAVTDSVLNAAIRLDLRDGSVLSVDEDAEYTTDGTHLIAMTWLERRYATRATVSDVDTGERIRSFRTHDASNLIPVQADPLVVGTERGHWGSDLYAERDGEVRRVGRGLGGFTATVDGRLVSGHPRVLVVADTATGEEVAVQDLDSRESVVGIDEGDAITVSRLPDWLPESGTVLRRVRLDGDPLVLGATATRVDHVLLVADGTAYVAAGEDVLAYLLPADGPATSAYVDRLAWRKDDLRPDDVLDACRAVSGPTLARLGLDPDELVNGSCSWGGGENPRIGVTAVLPTRSATAVDAAVDQAELLADGDEVDGLGDGAWLYEGSSYLQLTARHRNVIVTLTTTLDEIEAEQAREGVVEAAREVIAELAARAGRR